MSKDMATQSKARAERTRRIRAIMHTAQALADGKDPADFPEFGFSPRVERVAEIFREMDSRARVDERLAGEARS